MHLFCKLPKTRLRHNFYPSNDLLVHWIIQKIWKQADWSVLFWKLDVQLWKKEGLLSVQLNSFCWTVGKKIRNNHDSVPKNILLVLETSVGATYLELWTLFCQITTQSHGSSWNRELLICVPVHHCHFFCGSLFGNKISHILKYTEFHNCSNKCIFFATRVWWQRRTPDLINLPLKQIPLEINLYQCFICLTFTHVWRNRGQKEQ